MYKLISIAAIFFICFQLKAQYKNDNVLYKTVYPEDLAQQLKANSGFLLLDVRTKEENADTSMMGMNIGHFKKGKNINVNELGARINELKNYKDQPIFVYCSHSQRSRRASKMLADSGFTKVFNINGGMTALIQSNYGVTDIYETKNKFRYLSPSEFCKETGNKNTFLLDVRSDSAYNAITNDEQDNAIGKFKNAYHIALDDLGNSMSKLPKEKSILIIDGYGNQGVQAAAMLTSNGYNSVTVLFDGMYNLISSPDVSCKNEIWQQNRKYHTLTSDEFSKLAGDDKNIAIIDIREYAEFNNQSKNSWQNTGHIKNAINISNSDMPGKLDDISSYKNKPVIIYSFTSHVDAYNAAATLIANGFTNVNILAGGIFNLRWKAANLKGQSALKDWVVDVPASNL
ncbi:MAG: rhodanese-like domain-containing protein [Ginsengibacter sp.]